jgi:hypothetical protein
MAAFVRQSVVAVFFATALFSTSCEQHPLGQMPEVQREQPDPAKVWSNPAEQHSEAPAKSSEEAR